MDDIIVKTCVVCHTEKSSDDFYNKYRENETVYYWRSSKTIL